jgi:hypothetical protein
VGKPLSPEEIELCRIGAEAMCRAMAEQALEKHLRDGTTNTIAGHTDTGLTLLAQKLGIKRQAVSVWKTQGRIPFDRVDDVAKITGVSPRVLHPRWRWPESDDHGNGQVRAS